MANWRFNDEWLSRGLGGLKGAAEAELAARAGHEPYLSEALLKAGTLTREQLAVLVENFFKVRYLQLSSEKVDKFGVFLLKEKFCRKYQLLPVGLSETEIQLAAADPTDQSALALAAAFTGRQAALFYSFPDDIEACMERLFGPGPAAEQPETWQAAAAAAGGRPRVIIVDDDPVMRMLLRKYIEKAGCSVTEAEDGEAALKAMNASVPDLLVTDMHMPRMDGLELIKALRRSPALAGLPVIMLTTESSGLSKEMALDIGAEDYVIKPFKAPLLAARVSAALRRAGRLE